MKKEISNQEIARVFGEIADILELKQDNPFKIRAYRKAVQLIEHLEKPLSQVEDLQKLPGIGKELAEKIKILLEGKPLPTLEKLRGEVEPGLLELLKIRGLGPKRIKSLNQKLGVKDIESLRQALEDQTDLIIKLPGFGKKLVEDLKQSLKEFQEYSQRHRLDIAKKQADELVEYLKSAEGVKQIEVAGSLRRRKETIGDIDILVTGRDSQAVMERFVRYPRVREVLARGETKSSVVLESGIQVDVRFFAPESFGAGLCYFTGSKAHNIEVRTIAKQMGLKISEYGVFKGEQRIAGKTEEEVYQTLGLIWIPPELREARGEIELARKAKLPQLVELEDIKADLHLHSKWSDGRHPIEEVARRAKELGYKYIAITDHSKSQHQARGLDEKRLLEQFKEIDQLNQKIKGIRILKGVELDILKDGSLDLEPEVLKKADLVIGAIHSNFNLNKAEQTQRLIRALGSGLIHILAHPTCRLIGEREPIELDWERMVPVLVERKIAVEINASPHRLDASGELAKYLKEQGVKFALGTDAHTLGGLSEMEYGVYTARRGWLEAKDLLNTLSLKQFLTWLRTR